MFPRNEIHLLLQHSAHPIKFIVQLFSFSSLLFSHHFSISKFISACYIRLRFRHMNIWTFQVYEHFKKFVSCLLKLLISFCFWKYFSNNCRHIQKNKFKATSLYFDKHNVLKKEKIKIIMLLYTVSSHQNHLIFDS